MDWGCVYFDFVCLLFLFLIFCTALLQIHYVLLQFFYYHDFHRSTVIHDHIQCKKLEYDFQARCYSSSNLNRIFPSISIEYSLYWARWKKCLKKMKSEWVWSLDKIVANFMSDKNQCNLNNPTKMPFRYLICFYPKYKINANFYERSKKSLALGSHAPIFSCFYLFNKALRGKKNFLIKEK